MSSTLPTSALAVCRPIAWASFMQNASLNTIPSKCSMAGFRICVLGAPPSGMEI